jgi:hypothetical protein
MDVCCSRPDGTVELPELVGPIEIGDSGCGWRPLPAAGGVSVGDHHDVDSRASLSDGLAKILQNGANPALLERQVARRALVP